jgi:hypothetical protein
VRRALLALVLVAAPAAAQVETRPLVGVSVSLCCNSEAAPPEGPLRSFEFLPQRLEAERELAQAIAAELAERRPFIVWSADPAAGGTTLLVKLVETSSVPFSLVELKWFRKSAAGERALAVDRVTLFKPNQTTRNASDHAGFVSLARGKIAEALTSVFVDQLQGEFISKLPLATALTLLPDEKLVVLPVRWGDTRIGGESRLRVSFRSGAPESTGHLTLARPARRSRQPQPQMLQAAVSGADFDSQEVTLSGGWSDRLPGLLENARVSCFVEHYEQASDFEADEGVFDDVVVDPQ